MWRLRSGKGHLLAVPGVCCKLDETKGALIEVLDLLEVCMIQQGILLEIHVLVSTVVLAAYSWFLASWLALGPENQQASAWLLTYDSKLSEYARKQCKGGQRQVLMLTSNFSTVLNISWIVLKANSFDSDPTTQHLHDAARFSHPDLGPQDPDPKNLKS